MDCSGIDDFHGRWSACPDAGRYESGRLRAIQEGRSVAEPNLLASSERLRERPGVSHQVQTSAACLGSLSRRASGRALSKDQQTGRVWQFVSHLPLRDTHRTHPTTNEGTEDLGGWYSRG